MGAALYIALEKEVPGVDATSMRGNVLATAWDHLDAIASENGLLPLEAFMSADPDEAAEFLEDHGGASDFDIPDEQWFDPADGLATVRGLLKLIRGDPSLMEGYPIADVTEDLESAARVLALADERKVRFHFAVDF